MTQSDEFEWNVVSEGQLLESMVGHKPVGVNKYFQMAFICDKFAENLHKDISSDKVWAHLETMYNLEALDESESIPFPNSEKDFSLPENEFGTLLAKKEEDKKSLQKGRETPKSLKELKKEEKTPQRTGKEVQRRDSKDSNSKERTPASAKKEIKKETERNKNKGKGNNTPREENKTRTKSDDTPKPAKRPTRGSLKPDDSGSSGKSSPVTVTPPAAKRRRI